MTDDRSTWLGECAERIIEAGWLVVLVTTPLFFNVYSQRVFEPDKVVIVRSIALIIGLAWIVRKFERRGGRLRPVRTGLVSLALALFLVQVAASVFSVDSYVSIFGSYTRLQGLYTTSAYLVIFLSVVGLLRTHEQLERLITTALLTSLPVSLYGIVQYFGTDPILWAADVTVRVTSTMGNPIFVAAFLIMTVPLTLYRLALTGAEAAEGESSHTRRILVIGGLGSLAFQMVAWQSGPLAGTASAAITIGTWVTLSLLLDKPLIPFLKISAYTVLLSTQLMCLLFSQSRGPWLGLAGALFLFALLWTLAQARRRGALAVIGTGILVALVVVAINWQGSPFSFVRDIPYVGRAAMLTKTGEGSGRVRVLIWEGVTELITDDPARAAIGYGPETMGLVYPPYYRPELGHLTDPDAMADRSHNEIFDEIVTTGFTGLAVYLLFMTVLFYCGLRWTGTLPTRIRRVTFLSLWFAGGAISVALARLIDEGWRFAGVALPVGMFAGMLLYLCGLAFMTGKSRSEPTDGNGKPIRLVVVTVLAVVAAHFLETQIGLTIVATRTYFWVFAAVLVACGILRSVPDEIEIRAESSPDVRNSGHRLPSERPLIAASLVAGCMLMTLIYDFHLPNRDLVQPGSGVWLLAFSWAFGAFLVTSESWSADKSEGGGRQWVRALSMYSVITVATMLLYATVQGSALRLGIGRQNLISVYWAGLLALVLVLALALIANEAKSERIRSPWLGLSYLLLVCGVIYLAKVTNLDSARADVHFRRASRSFQLGNLDRAATEMRRAVQLEPEQDAYYLFLGKALIEQARVADERDSLMQLAEQALLRAQEISPLNPDHTANLARLNQVWAEQTDAGATRNERLRNTLTFFESATMLNPNKPSLWNERGSAFVLAGDTVEARRMYQHSLELDDRFYRTYLLIGNLHFAQKRWQDAIRAYESVLRLRPGLPQVQLQLAVAKARLERRKAGGRPN